CTHPLPAYPHPPPPLSPTPALHDALPILGRVLRRSGRPDRHLRPRGRERLALEPLATTGSMPCPTRPPASTPRAPCLSRAAAPRDRKSTRLNSSHVKISYAVFCLKKKKPP